MVYSIATFIPWLCFTLIFGGYKSILPELGIERIENFYYSYQQAIRLNIDESKFILLQACESRGKTAAKGDWQNETGKYLANGIYQFHKATWERYSEKYNWTGDYWNPKDQADLAAFMISQGEWENWWNCGKSLWAGS